MSSIKLKQCGPCPVCHINFVSRNANKKYCSMKCYVSSEEFKENSTEFKKQISDDKHRYHCLECGKDNIKTKHRAMKFCDQGCYRSYMSKRFDRKIANPELIALPQCYDEFLDNDEINCPIKGCGWSGKHLSNHVGNAHGITAREFKIMLGFNLSTGLVGKETAKKLREREHIVDGSNNEHLEKLRELYKDSSKNTARPYFSNERKEKTIKINALNDDNRPIKLCLFCKKEFKQKTYYNEASYCGTKCFQKDHYLKRKEKRKNVLSKKPLPRFLVSEKNPWFGYYCPSGESVAEILNVSTGSISRCIKSSKAINGFFIYGKIRKRISNI